MQFEIKTNGTVFCAYCQTEHQYDAILVHNSGLTFKANDQNVAHCQEDGFIFCEDSINPTCIEGQICANYGDDTCQTLAENPDYDGVLNPATRVNINGDWYCPACAAKLQNK